MKKSVSMICAILTTFIWGTTFVAQTTGMDMIGPLTFNGSRFFIGFLTLIPVALIFEKNRIVKEVNINKKMFYAFLDWVVFIFRNFFSTSSITIYRYSKCCFFYNFLCSHSSDYSFFILFTKNPLEYMALFNYVHNWSIFP